MNASGLVDVGELVPARVALLDDLDVRVVLMAPASYTIAFASFTVLRALIHQLSCRLTPFPGLGASHGLWLLVLGGRLSLFAWHYFCLLL